MAGHWTDEWSFTTGAIRRKDLAYLVGTHDKLIKKGPHSAIIAWDAGTWGQTTRKWGCTSCCVVKKPKEQLVAIGEGGQVYVVGSGEQHDEEMATGPESPKKLGYMRSVRAIEGIAYAAGMMRQVYRRDGADSWSPIDQGMRASRDAKVCGFEAIDGFAEKEIYAAGYKGEIWRYDGKKWRQVDSPTNLVLTNAICAGDDKVYACGQEGLLLRGRKDTWEIIDHQSTKQDLWGLAWYKDRLYLSSTKQVFSLEKGDVLERVRFGEDTPLTAYHLAVGDGVLWSIGAKDVMAHDGKTWTRID
ncbi:MAG TPA: hypothetical protein VKU80_11330 [Planctomycetota bacterium]|nr:hypothetical protein [Planctomycetota bacterium]